MAKIPYIKVTYRLSEKQFQKVKRVAKAFELSESEVIRQSIDSIDENNWRK